MPYLLKQQHQEREENKGEECYQQEQIATMPVCDLPVENLVHQVKRNKKNRAGFEENDQRKNEDIQKKLRRKEKNRQAAAKSREMQKLLLMNLRKVKILSLSKN